MDNIKIPIELYEKLVLYFLCNDKSQSNEQIIKELLQNKWTSIERHINYTQSKISRDSLNK